MRTPPIEIPRRAAPRAEKIDRYGELCRRIDEMEPLLEEHTLLKAEIQSWFAGQAPDQGAVAEGDLYTIQLTAKSKERTITKPMQAFRLLKQQLGLTATVALLKIPLGEAIDKFIPKSQHPQFLVQELTGSRRLKAVPKASPAAPAEPAPVKAA